MGKAVERMTPLKYFTSEASTFIAVHDGGKRKFELGGDFSSLTQHNTKVFRASFRTTDGF